MVGFKDNLAKHIDLVNTDSKYVMRFKCSEQPFKTDQPVFVGVAYIPPEYAKYSSEDTFSELQQQYLSSFSTCKSTNIYPIITHSAINYKYTVSFAKM
jgi:tRNA(Ile2) C34 agmatinyltransferase TiaS